MRIGVFGVLNLGCFFFFFFSSDHVFLCFAPSLVAAACVAASRLILHLSPTWPPRLQRLTGYAWENLIPCTEKLLMCVSNNNLAQSWLVYVLNMKVNAQHGWLKWLGTVRCCVSGLSVLTLMPHNGTAEQKKPKHNRSTHLTHTRDLHQHSMCSIDSFC